MTIKDLKQGDKFTYKGKFYLKLPDFCECYGHPSNAVNIRTGTMMWINPNTIVNKF